MGRRRAARHGHLDAGSGKDQRKQARQEGAQYHASVMPPHPFAGKATIERRD